MINTMKGQMFLQTHHAQRSRIDFLGMAGAVGFERPMLAAKGLLPVQLEVGQWLGHRECSERENCPCAPMGLSERRFCT